MRGLSKGRSRLLGTFWTQLRSPSQFRPYFSLQSQPGFLPPPLLKTPSSLDFSGAWDGPWSACLPACTSLRLSGVFPQVSLSVASRCWPGAESSSLLREHPLLAILLPRKVLFAKHSPQQHTENQHPPHPAANWEHQLRLREGPGAF